MPGRAKDGAPELRSQKSGRKRILYIVYFVGILSQGMGTILEPLMPAIKNFEKTSKFLKKGIDKRRVGWYSNKAVGAEAQRQGLTSLILKKLQKRARQTPCDVVT